MFVKTIMQKSLQTIDNQLITKLLGGGKMRILTIIFVCLSMCLRAQDADSLRVKILQCFNESRFVEVIDYSKQALAIYESEDDKYNMAGCYNTIAGAYMRLGQYDEAIINYNICTEIMDEIGGDMAAVNKRYVINNIAAIYYDMKEYDMAEEMYWKCIEMIGDPGTDPKANLDLATYYQNLSGVRLIQYEMMDADDPRSEKTLADVVDFAEQALDLSRRYNDLQEKIVVRRLALSKAYHEAKRFDEAVAQLDTAHVVAQRENNAYLETACVMLDARYAFDRGDNIAAEKYYLKALEMARENQYDQFYMDCLEGAYQSTRDSHPERALGYYEESIKMRDSIYNEDQQALIRDFQVKYQISEKEHELELEKKKAKQNRQLFSLSLLAVALLIILIVVLVRYAIQRKRQSEMLISLSNTKDQLFTIVSHDIKMPVLAQEQILDILCKDIKSIPVEYLEDYMMTLNSSTKELKNKILNVIVWVKGMLRETDLQAESFNLREMADKVLRGQSFEIGRKSLIVTNAIPDNWVANDNMQVIEMVLQNILSNAVKYSYADGEIRLEAEDSGERYNLKVIDHGQGISKEKLDKLLNTMTMSSEGTIGEKGTGIGLFVSRKIMELNCGTIAIESEEGKGTTVTISIKK